MAGRGPAPKTSRRRTNEPAAGEWRSTSRSGWQHGEIPQPPSGLRTESKLVWAEWFDAWYAAYWNVSDLPQLRRLIRLWNQCEIALAQPFVKNTTVRQPAPHTEVRQLLDSMGITPKGQQDRRWLRPSPPPPAAERSDQPPAETPAESPYSHLMN